jgi:integral membrane protein (TIGR01906 family)
MKRFNIIFRVIFIISIPLFLFSLSIGIAVNSRWLYDAGFKKYDISQVTGITQPELDKAATGLINYFNNDDEYLNVRIIKDGQPYKLYSEDEKQILHLKDVKALFWLDYKVLLGAFIFILAYTGVTLLRKNRRNLAIGLLGGGILTLGLMLALGAGILTSFDTLFTDFHLLSFSNDFWLLDPAKDVLIMMFPDGFWYDVVSFIAILTAGLAVVIGGVGWYLRKTTQNSKLKSQNHN